MKAFRFACVQLNLDMKNKYAKRWHLRTLATLPEHQNQGAGSKLCKYIMEEAKQSSTTLTLLCSSDAKRLYARLGFRTISSAVARVDGEKSEIGLVAMSIES